MTTKFGGALHESCDGNVTPSSRLNDMYGGWDNKKFIIEDYKATKTYIVKGTDEIQQLLDEHLNITQQLSFSPFKAFFTEVWGLSCSTYAHT